MLSVSILASAIVYAVLIAQSADALPNPPGTTSTNPPPPTTGRQPATIGAVQNTRVQPTRKESGNAPPSPRTRKASGASVPDSSQCQYQFFGKAHGAKAGALDHSAAPQSSKSSTRNGRPRSASLPNTKPATPPPPSPKALARRQSTLKPTPPVSPASAIGPVIQKRAPQSYYEDNLSIQPLVKRFYNPGPGWQLIGYHGTTNEQAELWNSGNGVVPPAPPGRNAQQLGPGIYVASDYIASGRYGVNICEVYVNMAAFDQTLKARVPEWFTVWPGAGNPSRYPGLLYYLKLIKRIRQNSHANNDIVLVAALTDRTANGQQMLIPNGLLDLIRVRCTPLDQNRLNDVVSTWGQLTNVERLHTGMLTLVKASWGVGYHGDGCTVA